MRDGGNRGYEEGDHSAPPPVDRAEQSNQVSDDISCAGEDEALTIDQLVAMMNNALDLALLLQMPDSYSRQTAVDLEPLDEDTLADESEGRDLLHDAVVGGLVKNDSMLCLVLDLALRPFLLLCGLTAAG